MARNETPRRRAEYSAAARTAVGSSSVIATALPASNSINAMPKLDCLKPSTLRGLTIRLAACERFIASIARPLQRCNDLTLDANDLPLPARHFPARSLWSSPAAQTARDLASGA